MSPIMSGSSQNDGPYGASSSAHPPSDSHLDELDFLANDDPLHGDLGAPISFKRRKAPSLLSGPSRLLNAITGSTSPFHRTSPAGGASSAASSNTPPRHDAAHLNASVKDGEPLDWYMEGPGRRVGYEDMTAIDWIFEYTKERQRLRYMYASASGLLGSVQRLVDASQIWVVLLLTGMLVGAIAAGIDVTTEWLSDLKLGYCSSGPEGGHFYLNKGFCCYGYDQGSKCDGWKSWGEAVGVTSAGGKWFVEYFFFIAFSVCYHVVVLGWL